MYDLAIVGGGPAGVAAGVYASRKRLKTVFITKDWNSQSTVSEGIENWIGTVKIAGLDFAKALEAHLRAYAADVVDIKTGELCAKIAQNPTGTNGNPSFTVTTDSGSYQARAILIATGSTRRKLAIPGADAYEHKGITYCASCDGPIFAGQDVAVIGGGNAAFESAAQLLAYCKSVTLLNRSDEFRADPVTVKKVLSNPKMRAITGAIPIAVKGDKLVRSLTYKDKDSGEEHELPVTGIFVEIGSVPATGFAKGVVAMDAFDRIVVDPRTQSSSVPGIWAAGDCCDGLYHQNNIAAGDAVKALEDIYVHLHAK
ncbi:MAG: FAD-dependent oxidoreductase [Patescibacteria group bacterium]|nr:FAD-dependent oxidoreductase [Patescibacteria group bacterium]MDE2116621.1 FAD-dependent oxidoreductase [Patescibacteria group bacterium]